MLAITAGILGTYVYRPAAGLRPYLASILLWSSIGFLLASAANLLLLIATLAALDRFPSIEGSGEKIAVIAFLLIGPFASAAVGLLGGAAFGVWRRVGKTRRE